MVGYDPNKIEFEVTDCRGIRIWCSEMNWHGKILGARPYLKSYIPLITQTITKPDFIFKDIDDESRNNYYMFHRYKENRYIKVVVKLQEHKKGQIISVCPVDKGKDGEILIWTPLNH